MDSTTTDHATPELGHTLLLIDELIPGEWFADWHWGSLAAVIAVSVVVLIKGADWLVEGASGLSYRLGMPKIIVGATVVSLGTTSPEAAVSVMAAWEGDSGLALGNAVGSVIADTGLIFGIGCMMAPLPADSFVLTRQGRVQFGSALVLAALCYGFYFHGGEGSVLGRPVGVGFLIGLVMYLYASVRWARQHSTGQEALVDEVGAYSGGVLFLIGSMLFGLLVVIVAARFLIVSVQELAVQMNVPPVVVSSTIVALGTSLPELVVGLTAVRRKHPEILIGNVIGADILNVLFVAGASATAKPLVIPQLFLIIHLPSMLVVLLLFRYFVVRACYSGSFARWNGVPLVLIYVAFVIIQYVYDPTAAEGH